MLFKKNIYKQSITKKIVNIIKFFYLFLFLILLCRCGNENKTSIFPNAIDTTNVTVLDLDEKPITDLSGLKYEDVKYIVLETNENCLIGEITDILIYNNNFFIFDLKYSNSLFVFDLNGKFIQKIGNKGKGPKEYINLDDFDIDKAGNIYLFDQPRTTVLKFSKSFDFIESFKFPYRSPFFGIINEDVSFFRLSTFIESNEKNIAALYNNNTLYYWNNKLNKITYSQFPYPGNIAQQAGGESYFRSFHKYLKQAYTDSIYEIRENGLALKYVLKYDNKKRISKDEINKMNLNDIELGTDETGLYLYQFYETNDFIVVKYLKSSKVYLYYKSKKTGNVISGERNSNAFTPDFFGGPGAIGTLNNGYFVHRLESLHGYIKQVKENNKYLKEEIGHLEIWNILKTLNEDSNPILKLYKLKDF